MDWRKHAERTRILISGVNTYDGKLTCKNVAESFEMEYTDLAEHVIEYENLKKHESRIADIQNISVSTEYLSLKLS